MGRTEEIYTVHVRSKPDPSQKYPSERAYSSSTVGGLAVTHIFLALLGTILSTAAFTYAGDLIGAVSLVSGCIISGLTGILASRRWYVDRYIRWFFAASFLSITTSLFTATLLMYCLLCQILNQHNFLVEFLAYDNKIDNIVLRNITAQNGTLTHNEISVEDKLSFQKELHIHLILTSLIEILVSIFSLKTAWKGVKNSYKKNPIVPVRTEGVGGYATEGNRPDILENHKNGGDNKLSNYTNVMKELYKLQKSTVMVNDTVSNKIMNKFYAANQADNCLPLPESQKEYQERMEKFLASNNQCDKETN